MRVAKRNEESKRSSRRCIFGGGFAFPSLPVALGFGENQGEFDFLPSYADWMFNCGFGLEIKWIRGEREDFGVSPSDFRSVTFL